MSDAAHQMQMLAATRMQSVCTLAASIITASGHPWSIEEALELRIDIYHAMFGEPSTGAFKEWAKTKDQRLKKVHGPK